MKKTRAAAVAVASVLLFAACITARAADPKTGFQTWAKWQPEQHLPADIAIYYSTDPAGIDTWRDRGFVVFTMIGASWLSKNAPVVVEHPEIKQCSAGGVPFEMIPGRAWVVPTQPWRDYIKGIADAHIDRGTMGILPEEPEFFAANGYSDSFKAEWKKFYGEPWRAPNSSITALWKANRLKAHLFTEFYADVFGHVKRRSPKVLCLIPAHSNLNYANWNIVAPHHAFYALPETDGFVGQVWTGTAKGARIAGGVGRSDVFAYSFLEYSYFENLVAGTKKRMMFLTDPVEDERGATWEKLRGWYEDTLTAALMQTSVAHYEVTPWPTRVFLDDKTYGADGGSRIPADYATELMTVWSAQRLMPGGGTFYGGSTSIGMLTADTLMWQRGGGRDRFAGHVAPMISLIRRGVYMRVLPAERMSEPGFPPKNVGVIVASFDAWKPETRQQVESIAKWVENGGVLLFTGGTDDFDAVEGAWWRGAEGDTPADALVRRLAGTDDVRKVVYDAKRSVELGIQVTERKQITAADGAPQALKNLGEMQATLPLTAYGVKNAEVLMTAGGKPVAWKLSCGKGTLIYAGVPGEFIAYHPEGEKLFLELIAEASEATDKSIYNEADLMRMRRGPFLIARAIDGSHTLHGYYIDLLRPERPIGLDVTIGKDENAFLLDVVDAAMKNCNPGEPACMVFAGGNASRAKQIEGGFEFTISGPLGVNGSAWLCFQYENEAPVSVTYEMPGGGAQTVADPAEGWHARTRTLRLLPPLHPDGTRAVVRF